VSDSQGLIDRTLLHYRIITQIGAGGMGEVYLALDKKLDREVALKVVPEDFASDPRRLARFEREAKAIAALNHPNIVTIHSIEEDQGVHFLTMELVEGRSLDQLVPRDGMSLEKVLAIAGPLTEALAAAHERGIIHRDLKPGNVMVTEEGRVKVLDFGLAKLLTDDSVAKPEFTVSQAPTETVTLTAAGIVVGTVPYLSPEYLDGQMADHRTDIFSLGVVLYEMVTGLLPFRGSSGPAVMSSILRDDPKPVSDLKPEAPAHLVRVIERCLEKDPEKRYQSASDVGYELVTMSGDSPTPSSPESRHRKPLTRKTKMLAVVALLALVVLLGSFLIGRWTGLGVEDYGREAGSMAAFDAKDWIIAVIPSRTLAAQDAELAVVNEGLAMTLTTKLTQLSQSHGLQVIPASTLFEKEISGLERARQELGVSLALNFSTHRLGNRIRVNAQLVDVANQRQITADTIDGDPNDLLALEEAVTSRVLRLLEVRLKPMEETLLAAGTTDPLAYNFFVKGQGHLQDYHDPANIEAAAGMFEKALEIDPSYAQAHAGLGEALWRNFRATRDLRWVDSAIEQCTRAIELDELDAAGHVCLGMIFNGTGRTQDAVNEFRVAKSLDPSRDLVYKGLADAYLAEGDLDLAEATYKEAVAVRPHYWAPYNWLGIFYFRHGRMEEALVNFAEMVRLAPDGYLGYSNLGATHYFMGQHEEARENFERALAINADDDLALSNLATMNFFAGRYDEATEQFERVVAINDKDFFNWGNLADAYRWGSGGEEQAAEAYRKAIALCEDELVVNPNDGVLLADMAYYFAMLGAERDALGALGRAMDLLPSDIEIQHRGAQVYQALGEHQKALNLLEQSVQNGYPAEEIRVDPLFADLGEQPWLP
jgi:serine/threonine protein kinase/tetratricopeptide (TPR) repeat protein